MKKKHEKNNLAIALSVLYAKNEKYNLCTFQDITQNVKKTNHSFNDSKQRRMVLYQSEITRSKSKQNDDHYCFSCLHSFRKKKIIYKKVCRNKDLCNVVMHFEDSKILEFNQYCKSHKAEFIIYAEIESLIIKKDGCKQNPEESTTTKVSQHIPSGFSVLTVSSLICMMYIGAKIS